MSRHWLPRHTTHSYKKLEWGRGGSFPESTEIRVKQKNIWNFRNEIKGLKQVQGHYSREIRALA